MQFALFKNQTRFKIALNLIDQEEGLSIMQLKKILRDVPQATLYRHVNAMFEEGLIKIVSTRKTRSGEENYYALNTETYMINEEEWNLASYEDKVNFITYYFMYVLEAYQSYHKTIDDKGEKDWSTFSVSKLNLTESQFDNFQSDMKALLEKYYDTAQTKEGKERTISLVIIP